MEDRLALAKRRRMTRFLRTMNGQACAHTLDQSHSLFELL